MTYLADSIEFKQCWYNLLHLLSVNLPRAVLVVHFEGPPQPLLHRPPGGHVGGNHELLDRQTLHSFIADCRPHCELNRSVAVVVEDPEHVVDKDPGIALGYDHGVHLHHFVFLQLPTGTVIWLRTLCICSLSFCLSYLWIPLKNMPFNTYVSVVTISYLNHSTISPFVNRVNVSRYSKSFSVNSWLACCLSCERVTFNFKLDPECRMTRQLLREDKNKLELLTNIYSILSITDNLPFVSIGLIYSEYHFLYAIVSNYQAQPWPSSISFVFVCFFPWKVFLVWHQNWDPENYLIQTETKY